jgi:hypothetical protein
MDFGRIEPIDVLLELVFALLNTVEFNLSVRNLASRVDASLFLTFRNGLRNFVLSPLFFEKFLVLSPRSNVDLDTPYSVRFRLRNGILHAKFFTYKTAFA